MTIDAQKPLICHYGKENMQALTKTWSSKVHICGLQHGHHNYYIEAATYIDMVWTNHRQEQHEQNTTVKSKIPHPSTNQSEGKMEGR